MQLNFNPSQTTPSTGNSICLPLNDYNLEIIKEEQKAVKDKPQSGILVYHLRVLDGPYQGQTQRMQLNLWNHDSQKAVEIAQGEFTALALVTGRIAVTDTSQLVGARLIATIGPQDDNPKYSEVKILKDTQGRTVQDILSGASAPSAQVAPPVQQQTAQFPPPPPQQQAQFQPPAQQTAFAPPPPSPQNPGWGPQPGMMSIAQGGFPSPAQQQPQQMPFQNPNPNPPSPFGNAQPTQVQPAWTQGK